MLADAKTMLTVLSWAALAPEAKFVRHVVLPVAVCEKCFASGEAAVGQKGPDGEDL